MSLLLAISRYFPQFAARASWCKTLIFAGVTTSPRGFKNSFSPPRLNTDGWLLQWAAGGEGGGSQVKGGNMQWYVFFLWINKYYRALPLKNQHLQILLPSCTGCKLSLFLPHSLSLPLSLSHTHTHTHTHKYVNSDYNLWNHKVQLLT